MREHWPQQVGLGEMAGREGGGEGCLAVGEGFLVVSVPFAFFPTLPDPSHIRPEKLILPTPTLSHARNRNRSGMIEAVMHSATLAKIQTEYGGTASGAFAKTTLVDYLKVRHVHVTTLFLTNPNPNPIYNPDLTSSTALKVRHALCHRRACIHAHERVL